MGELDFLCDQGRRQWGLMEVSLTLAPAGSAKGPEGSVSTSFQRHWIVGGHYPVVQAQSPEDLGVEGADGL